MLEDKIEYLIGLFKLKCEGQFSLTDITRFIAPVTKTEWAYSRNKVKEILLTKIELGELSYANKRKTMFKFVDKVTFHGYPNKYNLVGKLFVELNVTSRTAIIYKKEGMCKCHMCGYIPAHCQAIFNVLVGDVEIEVIMCPNCDRVIIEV